MDIEVLSRNKVSRDLIMTLARFYEQELKLTRSTYKLVIMNVPGLAKNEKIAGMVTIIGDKSLVLVVDSRLSVDNLIESLAHEMVHVKQIVRGHLKQVTKRGRSHFLWLGKRYNVDYFDTPWELEAYGRQAILANKINKLLLNAKK